MKYIAHTFMLALALFCQPATIVRDVDQAAWLTCGNCGNTGATGATAAYSATLSPVSEDGAATKFSILPGTKPYANGYWWQERPEASGAEVDFVYEFDLYISSTDQTAPQAIEWECQKTFDGFVYNMGWQDNYQNGEVRAFDYGLKRWDDTGVAAVKFEPGVWHRIVVENHVDTAAHRVFHDAITVDGTRHALSVVHAATFTGSTRSRLTNAFQLDSNFKAQPFSVYVDKMRVTASQN
jgi:hypothetical protein